MDFLVDVEMALICCACKYQCLKGLASSNYGAILCYIEDEKDSPTILQTIPPKLCATKIIGRLSVYHIGVSRSYPVRPRFWNGLTFVALLVRLNSATNALP